MSRIPVRAPGGPVFLLAIAALVLLAVAPAVLAADPVPPPPLPTTVIEISAPDGVTIGTSVSVKARLTTTGGAPLAGRRLILGINDIDSRTNRTGADGFADLSVPSSDLESAGTLAVSVTFDGDSSYQASSASASIVVRPASIVVVTVPAVPGIHMTLGDAEAATDAQGTATFLVTKIGRQQLVPDLELPADGGLQVSFVRWEDDVFQASRNVNVNGDDRFVLGLRTAIQTSIRFVDPSGHEVDASRVESVKLVTAAGQDRTLTTYQDVWLEAAVPVKRIAGLIAVPNVHRVSEVIIAGTNVVNRGQQVFEPQSGDVLTVGLLLYGLEVRAEDALLRWPVSSEVRLEFPDGSIRSGRTDDDGRIAFDDLPRGDYTIRLITSGIVPPNPIALSRPQAVTIRVISTLDVSIFGGAVLLGVIGLVLLGRRHQVRSAGQRAVGLAGAAADQAAVAATRSDRTAQALLDRLATSIGARLRFRGSLPKVRPGLPKVRQGLPKLRPALPTLRQPLPTLRPGLPKVRPGSVDGLRTRATAVGSRPWVRAYGLTEAQRLRLVVLGVALVVIGMFAAVVAVLGQSPGVADVSPSPSATIAPATPRPAPSPDASVFAARLRPIIEVNAYLADDRAALEAVLASSPPAVGDLVSLISHTAVHARVAIETLNRVGDVGVDQPLIVSLASRYGEISKVTTEALGVLTSDAAAYEANARTIAALLADLEPLTAELHVVIDAPSPNAALGEPSVAPSPAP